MALGDIFVCRHGPSLRCAVFSLSSPLLLLGGDTCLALMAGSSLVYGATGSIMWTGRLLVQEVLCSG